MAIVATINLDFLMQARRNDEFRTLLSESTALNIVDGWPVVWLLRRVGIANAVRAAGADVLRDLLSRPEFSDTRIFLLGDTAETLNAVLSRGEAEGWSGRIVGYYSPPPAEVNDDEQSRRIVDRVNASGAHVLVVGFGTPRQEFWMNRWSQELRPRVGIGIGGALKFVAWPRRRAPKWMQELGLEWLHRATLEPRRLVPRYTRNFIDLIRIALELRRTPPVA